MTELKKTHNLNHKFVEKWIWEENKICYRIFLSYMVLKHVCWNCCLSTQLQWFCEIQGVTMVRNIAKIRKNSPPRFFIMLLKDKRGYLCVCGTNGHLSLCTKSRAGLIFRVGCNPLGTKVHWYQTLLRVSGLWNNLFPPWTLACYHGNTPWMRPPMWC